jgi:hypothetical protein
VEYGRDVCRVLIYLGSLCDRRSGHKMQYSIQRWDSIAYPIDSDYDVYAHSTHTRMAKVQDHPLLCHMDMSNTYRSTPSTIGHPYMPSSKMVTIPTPPQCILYKNAIAALSLVRLLLFVKKVLIQHCSRPCCPGFVRRLRLCAPNPSPCTGCHG